MNICSLGRHFHGATEIDFDSVRTILDFEAVFIDCVGFVQGQGKNPKAIEFRRTEFSEFLALGRTIVVFTAPVQLEVFLPVQAPDLKPIAGNKFDFKGSDQLKAFWKSVERDMQFLAYFEKVPGQPFLFVSATSKPVAALVKHERGSILLLPWLKPDGYDPHYQRQCENLITAFKKLDEHLSPKKPIIEFPAWSTHYGWDSERALRTSLLSLQKQSDELSKKINDTSKDLDAEDRLKALFTLKGDSLLHVVIEVFRSLGAKAEGGEPGRDDIVIEFEGKTAVAEVKGKKKSAAEEDAAQLEKWVAGFKADKGVDPKGILLVNAFCETPLSDRIGDPFPNQMLKYSMQREHCLITTIQLLGLLLEARAYPEKRVELVNSLFSTIGVYQQFQDWRAFLVAPTPAPTKTS